MKPPKLKTNCPNPACPDPVAIAKSAVTKHSYLKTKSGTRRRYACSSCGKTFAATTSTVYERMRKSKSDFDRPLTIREIFSWVPPSRPKWGRKAMAQMATEY